MVSLVVLGDIHVSVGGRASDAFHRIVRAVADLGPGGVVLCGDATSGNPRDGHSLEDVRRWWRGLEEALAPLRARRIPILPIAGNHDSYTEAHREGYHEAFRDLQGQPGAPALSGEPPLYYSCDLGGAHLSFAHVIDQEIDERVADWLRQDLAAAAAAPMRLVFGHVPLESVMGHIATDFRQHLGSLLVHGGASAYLCGHEHLIWDQLLAIDGSTLRQIIVGTPGAGYTYPIRADLYARHCQGSFGALPATGVRFAIDPATRLQRHTATFAVLTLDGDSLQVRHLAVDEDGGLVDFDERAAARWLRRGLARLLGVALPEGGDYDDATRDAVLALQRREGLEPDGVAGPMTRRRLRELLGEP